MKISENDIQILEKKENPNNQLTNPNYTYYWNPSNNLTITRCLTNVSIKPDKFEDLKGLIWNEELKIGIRDFNIDEWILLNGVPKYPITIKEDGFPELVKEYNWK